MALFYPRTRSLGDEHGKHAGPEMFKKTLSFSLLHILHIVDFPLGKFGLHLRYFDTTLSLPTVFRGSKYEQYDECRQHFLFST